MKTQKTRTIVALATLLSTVFLTGCLGDSPEALREQQITDSSIAIEAESPQPASNSTPMSKFDFSEGRMVKIATWYNFPDNNSTSYIIQDVATDMAYMVIAYTAAGAHAHHSPNYTITPLYDYDGTILNLRQ